MGSGTSKDNVVETFEASEDEEKDKKKDRETSEEKEVSAIGKVFGKPKAKAPTNHAKSRTIVDLSSSDSEDEYFQPKADKDTELREEISSLETVLSSLGLDKKGRHVRVAPPSYSSDSETGYISTTTSHWRGCYSSTTTSTTVI